MNLSPRDRRPAATSHWFAWWMIAVVLAGTGIFEHQHDLTQDGMTYLDMARDCLHSGPEALIQPMWNPLYPAILAAEMAVFRPSPHQEIPLAHFLHWILFAAMAASFILFLRTWEGWRDHNFAGKSSVSPRLLSFFGFAVFLWICPGSAGILSPDVLVTASVFLAAWCCVRMAEGASWKIPVLLGIVLGLAYYAKPAGIPIAGILLGFLFLLPPGVALRRQVLVAAAVFVLVSLPLIAAISRGAGHLTTSESGKLNYVWHVNSYFPFVGWVGQGPPDHGAPLHPPRVLMSQPLTIEFATPVKGTYPLWYDPSYWYAGVRTQFNLRQEASAAIHNLINLYGQAAQMPVAWAGVLVLLILGWRQRTSFATPSGIFWAIAWPIGIFFLFSLIHIEPRYMEPFEVLLAIAAYSALIRGLDKTATGVVLVVSVFLLMEVLTTSSFAFVHAVRQLRDHHSESYELAAERLLSDGLNRGDRVATAGYSFDAYWAHVDDLHIAAQVLDENQFWKMDSQQLAALIERLKALDVKAIIARGGPASPGGNWQELPPDSGIPYRVMLLK